VVQRYPRVFAELLFGAASAQEVAGRAASFVQEYEDCGRYAELLMTYIPIVLTDGRARLEEKHLRELRSLMYDLSAIANCIYDREHTWPPEDLFLRVVGLSHFHYDSSDCVYIAAYDLPGYCIERGDIRVARALISATYDFMLVYPWGYFTALAVSHSAVCYVAKSRPQLCDAVLAKLGADGGWKEMGLELATAREDLDEEILWTWRSMRAVCHGDARFPPELRAYMRSTCWQAFHKMEHLLQQRKDENG